MQGDGDGCAGVSDEPFKPFCKWVDAELVFVFGAARDVGKAICSGHGGYDLELEEMAFPNNSGKDGWVIVAVNDYKRIIFFMTIIVTGAKHFAVFYY